MKRSIQIILTVCGLMTLTFLGCKKKETVTVDNETQSSVDNAVADQEYASIVPTTNGHAINTKGTGTTGRMAAGTCDSLTLIQGNISALGTNNYSAYPVYTLDVSGACSLTIPDGKIRSGTLKIRLTDKIRNVGAKMIIYMINYKTGLIGYSCDSIVVTTLASDTVTHKTSFNVKLINGVCSSSAWLIKYSSDRTFTNYSKGNPVGTDGVAEVFGTANAINRQGRAFTVNIPSTTPLIKHKSCQFIDKGILDLTPDGFKTRSIDFGNGTCDDDATFTVNGNTVAFKLK